jgi:hypothetical protein
MVLGRAGVCRTSGRASLQLRGREVGSSFDTNLVYMHNAASLSPERHCAPAAPQAAAFPFVPSPLSEFLGQK